MSKHFQLPEDFFFFSTFKTKVNEFLNSQQAYRNLRWKDEKNCNNLYEQKMLH